MNFNPSPKSVLQNDPNLVKIHRALVEREDLHKSINVALLQISREICELAPTDMGSCAAAHLRMLGAQEFVKVFLNLAETPMASIRTESGNLPSNVAGKKN